MRYFALDFETGNASPLSACALGVSIFEDGRLVGERVSLLKPPACAGKFHWGNVRVNHIKENMVQDAPSFASFWRELAPPAEGSLLVAHNAMFDTGVLWQYALDKPAYGALRAADAGMPLCVHGKGFAARMAGPCQS